MDHKIMTPHESIALFVKQVMVFEGREKGRQTVLPFFADGYPGLIYHETEKGLWVNPHNKQMPSLFLYGQTIRPVELVLQGAYRLVVFQLYPFVLKSFFNVNPKDLNDDCYNLELMPDGKGAAIMQQLEQSSSTGEWIGLITDFLYARFRQKKETLDLSVRQAIQQIINHQGQVSIAALFTALNLSERTFERRFLSEVGIPPKQFAKIIQFQQSLEQLRVKSYTRLTDIVYANGFADQSHFIRVFKAFTGQTPKQFRLE